MELGFRIPIVSGIPDSLSCIPDSKAQDSGFHKPRFPGIRNQDSITWGDSRSRENKSQNWLYFNLRDFSPCDICTLFCDRQVKSKLKNIVIRPHSLHTFTCRAIISFFADTFISIANVNTPSFIQAGILETLAS